MIFAPQLIAANRTRAGAPAPQNPGYGFTTILAIMPLSSWNRTWQ